MTEEAWRTIPGYEGLYEISSIGLIKSLPRLVWRFQGSFISKERILNPAVSDQGYLRTPLCKDGKQKYYYVHILVAEAFLGPRPKDCDVDHIDKNRLNCRLENLRYLHYSKNRGKPGSSNPNSHESQISKIGRVRYGDDLSRKLNSESVLEIRKLIEDGFKHTEIAKKYNIDPSMISKIKIGLSWRDPIKRINSDKHVTINQSIKCQE